MLLSEVTFFILTGRRINQIMDLESGIKDKNGACLDFSKAGELGLDDAYDA